MSFKVSDTSCTSMYYFSASWAHIRRFSQALTAVKIDFFHLVTIHFALQNPSSAN